MTTVSRHMLHTIWLALDCPASSLDHASVTGSEALASRFTVSDLAAASVGAAALAVADLIRDTGGKPSSVVVDRRLASLWFSRSIQPIGWALPPAWDSIAGDYPARDGWIRLHTNAPHHRAAALVVLDCADDRAAVTKAVAASGMDDLETAIVTAGGCAAAMRSVAAWTRHAQGFAVSSAPLIAFTRSPGSATGAWRPGHPRPLSGLKVLDLTRILAGPVGTRFLAGYGADVLRIDPPGWEEPSIAPDVTLGKRCARLDLEKQDDRKRFEDLLSQADVIVHGYRADALDRLGYGDAARRSINPDLIDIALNAYGWSGPWRERRGFDSLVQMSAGIAEAGMAWKHADRPAPLPVQALDHATGYLMAAAAIRALMGRLNGDGAMTARLSLARCAKLLVEDGDVSEPADWREPDANDLASPIEETPWGPAQRFRPPVSIAGHPMTWDRPASNLGSAPASWVG